LGRSCSLGTLRPLQGDEISFSIDKNTTL
jgi:hypothetical protein